MAVTRQLFKNLANELINNVFADFMNTWTFESIIKSTDDQGGYIEVWSTFATVQRGVVELKLGGEIVESTMDATKIDQNEVFMFQFEHIAGLTNDMRINYKGEYFNIKQIKPALEVDVFTIVEAIRGGAQ